MHNILQRTLLVLSLTLVLAPHVGCREKKAPAKEEHKPGDGHDHADDEKHSPNDGHDHGSATPKK
ncbi:MAG: hypothetical protein HOW73_37890 [Polyangiaceae bacterium]|nr:hypothetical protein [Polyangiaceae bacterium]